MERLEELYGLLEQLRTDDNEEEIEQIKRYIELGDMRKSFSKAWSIDYKKKNKYR